MYRWQSDGDVQVIRWWWWWWWWCTGDKVVVMVVRMYRWQSDGDDGGCDNDGCDNDGGAGVQVTKWWWWRWWCDDGGADVQETKWWWVMMVVECWQCRFRVNKASPLYYQVLFTLLCNYYIWVKISWLGATNWNFGECEKFSDRCATKLANLCENFGMCRNAQV